MLNGRALLVAAILLVLTSGPSHAQRNEGAAGAEPTRNPRLLGRWYYGPVYSSAVHGDRVYFGSGGAIRVLRIEEGASREFGADPDHVASGQGASGKTTTAVVER